MEFTKKCFFVYIYSVAYMYPYVVHHLAVSHGQPTYVDMGCNRE